MNDHCAVILSDRRLTLEHLRTFACIAAEGSFQAASFKLNRTQSALTQSLKHLEDIIGSPLVLRIQGHISGLTPEGTRLLPLVMDILLRLDKALSYIRETELSGFIRLGVPDDFNITDILSSISYLLSVNPNLKLQVVSALSDHLLYLIDNNELDIAIFKHTVSESALNRLALKNICHLWTEPLHWVSRDIADFNRIEFIPFIGFPQGCAYRSAVTQVLKENDKDFFIVYESASYDNIKIAISSGLGISSLPQSSIGKEHMILSLNNHFPVLPPVHLSMEIRTKGRIYTEFSNFIIKSLSRLS
ncbi:LysR family transcriptional regulator [Acerihabitans sp. KWT182]|uniref:LysR family transcriptional regulator n=1 Tax=Acerihabitans sp. KWT182 TaxID=3157919 RepID=A0AAU7Q7J9_9GAMM